MDDESGESMEPMEEVPLKRLGESEMERLVRGWRVLISATLFNIDRSPRIRCTPLTRAICLHFAARRYMYVALYVLSSCVRPSDCPSVARKYAAETDQLRRIVQTTPHDIPEIQSRTLRNAALNEISTDVDCLR